MLIADTGAGHRACAEALCAGLKGRATTQIVDLSQATGFSWLPNVVRLYDWFHHHRILWRYLWYISNKPHRIQPITKLVSILVRDSIVWNIETYQSDLMVVLHPGLTRAAGKAIYKTNRKTHIYTPILITVVTDPISPHAAWFEPNVDHMFVSSYRAQRQAQALGVTSEKISVIGHPIHPRVHTLVNKRSHLRTHYQWSNFTVLIIGGLITPETCLQAHLTIRSLGGHLVIVCGRDRNLYKYLKKSSNIEVIGHVQDLPERMCAADLVISKAGPSTLAECKAVGTPILIPSYFPGQEEGNLHWIKHKKFGEIIHSVSLLPEAITSWFHDPHRCIQIRNQALRADNKPPANQIAEQIIKLAQATTSKHK